MDCLTNETQAEGGSLCTSQHILTIPLHTTPAETEPQGPESALEHTHGLRRKQCVWSHRFGLSGDGNTTGSVRHTQPGQLWVMSLTRAISRVGISSFHFIPTKNHPSLVLGRIGRQRRVQAHRKPSLSSRVHL